VTIAELFWQLRDSPSGHMFTAGSLPDYPGIYIAADTNGRPCIFMQTEERAIEPPLHTAHVSLNPSQEYILTLQDGQQQTGRFFSICCETTMRSDINAYLLLIDAFLSQTRPNIFTYQTLTEFFSSIVRLFALGPVRDIQSYRQGLWGELFMMRQTRGYRFWAPFWHSEMNRAFDFSTVGRRVEVKTAAGTQRVHHFSHRQIYALENEEILIASILVREDDAGISLQELISECRAALRDSPFYLKIEKAVRHSGMVDLSETGPRYDATEPMTLVAWVRSTDAPRFTMPEPPGVTETRYKVDLSLAPHVSLTELNSWLDTWRT
jgi:hypothetical protein